MRNLKDLERFKRRIFSILRASYVTPMVEECKGMPPSWDIYVTVDDVDAVVTSVTELGGKVIRPAFNIPEVGRFCQVQDPQGAVIMAMSYLKK